MGSKKMKALVWLKADFDQLKIVDLDIPEPGKGEALVKVVAAAINPVDWKGPLEGMVKDFPSSAGIDYTGYVAKIGTDVHGLHVGDAVFGFTTFGKPGTGTFAEYSLQNAEMALKKPNSLSFEQAAALPMNMTTAGQAFKEIGIPLVSEPSEKLENNYILIWGASTTVGTYAVQLAKFAGLQIIATCSPHNFEYVKSLGAQYTLDYHSDDVGKKIQEIAKNNLHLAIECSGNPNNKLSEALTGNAKLAYVVKPPDNLPSSVKGFSVYGGKVFFDNENKEWFHKFWDKFLPLVEKGKVRTPEIETMNGLEGILMGLRKLSEGKISAKKQVGILASPHFDAAAESH